MAKPNKRASRTVLIGGKRVPVVVAALMGQQAHRRRVLLSRVKGVSIPDSPPTHVKIAGNTLTLWTAAYLASVADARGVRLSDVMEEVLEKRFGKPSGARKKKARGRKRKRAPRG